MTRLSLPFPFFQLGCIVLMLHLFGCKTQNDPTIKLPIVGAATVTDITTSTAKATSPLSDVGAGVLGTSTISEYGICYGTKEKPTTGDSKVTLGTSTTTVLTLVAPLSGLVPGTTYYVRGYVVYDGGTVYGDQAQFTTNNLKAPELTIADAADLTSTSFSIAGRLTSLGTSNVTQHGHVMSATNQTPTLADTKTELGAATSAPKDLKSTFSNLAASTTYYVRAYATNASGTGYSEAKTLKTNAEVVPSVTTLTFEQIGPNAARANGFITNGGTRAITQYGHVWSSTNQTPTISDGKSDFGATVAPKEYVSGLPGLTINTTYYVRAYATSAAGTGYGEMKTFKTLNEVAPSVTTQFASSMENTNGNFVGTLTSIGTKAVSELGHVWSSSNQNPTINDLKYSSKTNITTITNPGGSGYDYSSPMPDLTPNTTYYVRAYATSSVGTTYGDTKTAKTKDIQPLAVTMGTVSGITSTAAAVTGNVTGRSGPITVTMGFYYSSTNPRPNQYDSQVSSQDYNTPSFFSNTLKGLQPNTTYYIRPFTSANSFGIGYGNIITFTTQK